mmetsp:Transcript_9500/g.19106  ORF Transcript_9500/g.19106 Transcript_9500/m.19106 type:complete len:397 (-) Transcript_9500:70-1260(-)
MGFDEEVAAQAVETRTKKTYPKSIEDTNLAGIGSEVDRAAREAAAKIDFNWDDSVGSQPGVEIWRVENKRTENDHPDFGIKEWPNNQYGQFHRGDSYIVLLTTKDPNGGEKLLWDIYFWIGSESSQDEYGVAAYKTVELDDLLGGEPMQHREIEGRESSGFVHIFSDGITYLEGGVDSGFRQVSDEDGNHLLGTNRLYRVYKKAGEQTTRCFEVAMECSSLNHSDAFLLDAGSKVFTWFGDCVSPFERNKSASVAHNIKENRLGDCECILGVEDDNEEFWELLGGKGEIKADKEDVDVTYDDAEKKMFCISDAEGSVGFKQVPLSESSLASKDVFIIDTGSNAYVWIGKDSTSSEKQQAIIITCRYLQQMDRHNWTCVTRILEGQEDRCKPFLEVF